MDMTGLGFAGSNRGGYYVDGMGTFQNEPLVTRDENGQRVVQSGGVQRTGKLNNSGGLDTKSHDRLTAAYDTAKASTSGALKRWQASRTAEDEERALKDLWEAYSSAGDFNGSFDEFKRWFLLREAGMTDDLMDVSALQNSLGIATKTADGRAINRSESNGGFQGSNRVSGAYRAGSGYAW